MNGTADGTGTLATFLSPSSLAWDGARTLFVADEAACNIRKIDLQSAQVTTIAGTPPNMGAICAHADGTGTAAHFASVQLFTYDGQGTIYVAEQQSLRKLVVATGVVSSGPLATGPVQQIASDGNGALWTLAGGEPAHIAVSTGQPAYYMTPQGNNVPIANAQTVTFAPDGTMFLGTFDAIYSLDLASGALTLVGGVMGYGDAVPYRPSIVGALASTRLNYVNGLDIGPDGILYTRANDTWISVDTMSGTSAKVMGSLSFPCCMDLRSDGKGTIYAIGYDSTFRSISIGSASGEALIAGTPNVGGFADGAGSAAKFAGPFGLAMDFAHGAAYIADTFNAVIRKVDIGSGQVSTFVGTANMVGYVDDVGAAARLAHPRALVYDGAGTLYFGDDDHVRKATVPGGLVSTVAGSHGQGSADGPPGTGQFYSPNGLVLDAARQNLYVTDQLSNTVRKVALATGVVTTVAGIVGQSADAPGPLATATLNQPLQIVLGPKGDLLVATPREQSILRIRLP
ncbi:MAG TPA: hypothetical protein VF945_16360 [Polyangia bacterium]